MTAFIVRRLIFAVPTVLGVTLLTFVLLHLAPGGPALALAGQSATPDQVARITHQLGLDRPLPVQYVAWVGALLHGDLGESFIRHTSVTTLIAQRLEPTLLLMGTALFVSVLIALPLGVFQAYRNGTSFDRTASIIVFVAWSMPTFWLGTLLIGWFAVDLHWLPVGGIARIDVGGFDLWSRIEHLVLPVVTLSLVSVAAWSRYLRGNMIEQMREDFVRTARAKGLSPRIVLFRHTLRNALIPFVTLLGGSLPAVFGGAVITEQLFAYPGMGQLFWQAAVDRDYPVLLGVTTITAALVIIGNLIADVLYAVIDPRVRVQ